MSSGVKWLSGCSLPMIVGRGSCRFRLGLAVWSSRAAVGAGAVGCSSGTVSVGLRPKASSACRIRPGATLLRCRFAKTPTLRRRLRASSSGIPARNARYETLRTSGICLRSPNAARAPAKRPRGTASCGCVTEMPADFREATAFSGDAPGFGGKLTDGRFPL